MSIQRYGDPSHDYMTPAHDEGFLVLYTDHVAAVAQARSEVHETEQSLRAQAFRMGYADALDKAIAVAAAMPTAFWINGGSDEAQAHKAYVRAAIDGVCPCGGVGSGCRCEKEKP